MFIREAKIQDIDQILAIEEFCYDHPWPREAFEEEIENGETGVGLLAEDEGLVVGFLTGMAVVNELHLHNLAVHPDFRGKGVAKGLLETAEEFCHDHDLRRILLEVRRDNEIAQHLYLSMGYVAVGTRKDYYGPGQDGDLFTKDLEPK